MPFELPVSKPWKVKIHDSERLEDPHVTIYRKMDKWRLNLRDGTFLDKGRKWSQIDETVRQAIEENWEQLCEAWDELHPRNPVSGEDDE